MRLIFNIVDNKKIKQDLRKIKKYIDNSKIFILESDIIESIVLEDDEECPK